MHKILIVCMGNLCRSPLALGALRGMLQQRGLNRLFHTDSAGTHARRQVGQRPDPRAIAVAARRGYADLSKQRARCVKPGDFQEFDLIVAMDSDNLASLRKLCPAEIQHKLYLLLEFAPALAETEIPDPYYSNLEGFERVLDLCEAGVAGLIEACLHGQLPPVPRQTR